MNEVWERVALLMRQGDPSHSRCLYHAAMTMAVLRREGLPAQIQAGTLSWPRVQRGEDDGVSDTHFSYVFDRDSELTRHYLAGGGPVLRQWQGNGQPVYCLPEIHVWVGLVPSQEIVDSSTGGLMASCKAATGLPWTAAPPPPYLWCKGRQLPDWVCYLADPVAIRVAYKLLETVLTQLTKGAQ